MTLLPLLALLQDAAPQAAEPKLRNRGVILYTDYPEAALRSGDFGIVSVLAEVDAEGKVSACHVTESSGSSSLDLATCRLFTLRARFTPATVMRGGWRFRGSMSALQAGV